MGKHTFTTAVDTPQSKPYVTTLQAVCTKCMFPISSSAMNMSNDHQAAHKDSEEKLRMWLYVQSNTLQCPVPDADASGGEAEAETTQK